MLSCKAIYPRQFTMPSRLVSRILHTQIMCAGLIDLFMVLSRHLVHGTAGLPHISCSLIFEAKSDTSLFIYHRGEDVVYLLLYVDDIILAASSAGLIQHTITAPLQEFSMKDFGDLHQFLGMQIQRVSSGLSLDGNI